MKSFLDPAIRDRTFVYTVAVASVCATTSIGLLGQQHLGGSSYIVFMAPVVLSASLGGFGPGLTATLLSAFFIAYFFIPPNLSVLVEGPDDLVRLVIFLLVSLVTALLAEARRRADQGRLASEAIFRTVLDGIEDYAIVYLDPGGRVASWHRAGVRLSQYQEEEVLGQHIRMFYDEGDRRAGVPERGLELAERNGRHEEETWRVRKDGTEYLTHTVTTALRGPDGSLLGFARVSHDITALRRNEQTLRHRATHDSLTGLPNRVAFEERVQAAIAEAEACGGRFTVCHMDLDSFKEVNDTYGHAAGDEVLREVAHCLWGALRAGDMVARLGGDEFGILIRGLGRPDELEPIALRLLSAVRDVVAVQGRVLGQHASLGAASFPESGRDFAALLHAADRAMYAAKRAGHGAWVHAGE